MISVRFFTPRTAHPCGGGGSLLYESEYFLLILQSSLGASPSEQCARFR